MSESQEEHIKIRVDSHGSWNIDMLKAKVAGPSQDGLVLCILGLGLVSPIGPNNASIMSRMC